MLLRALLLLVVLLLGKVSSLQNIPLSGHTWERAAQDQQGFSSVGEYGRRDSDSRSLSNSVSDSERRVSAAFLKSIESQMLKAIQNQLQSARRAGTLSQSSANAIYQEYRREANAAFSAERRRAGILPAPLTSVSSPVDRRSLVSSVSKFLDLDKRCCDHRVVCPNKRRRRKRQLTVSDLAQDLAKWWTGASQRLHKIKENMVEKLCCAFDKGCPTGIRTG